MPPSSGLKSKQRNKPTEPDKPNYFLAQFKLSVLKMEIIYSSETPDFLRSTSSSNHKDIFYIARALSTP
jgi:hypothetical protein